MLRAEELMVGDWVHCTYPAINKCLRVAEIKTVADDELKVVLFDDVRLVFPEKHISPIPITPEILEKNGFKKIYEDFCVRYVSVSNIEKRLPTVIEFSIYGECVSADTLFKCWTGSEGCDGINDIHICDLKYVHQMQHALRLCGIDKTIEL